MGRVSGVRHVDAGVAEILHSPGVVAIVQDWVTRTTNTANAMGIANRGSMSGHTRGLIIHNAHTHEGWTEPFVNAPYEGEVKEMPYDTIGIVRTNTNEGAYDNKHNNTLKKAGNV